MVLSGLSAVHLVRRSFDLQETILTSPASAPAISAILALVNDALIAAGKPTLGFLNPWLYGGGYKAFNDVTTGSNYGCDTTGFAAVPGWDAATGWGTPVGLYFVIASRRC